LISDRDYARLKAMFSGRTMTLEKPGLRKHLLSWGELAVCGVCGGPLRSSNKGWSKERAKKPIYVCASNAGCVGRDEAMLDAFVSKLVVEVLSGASAVEVFRRDDTAALAALERAEGLRVKQAETAEDYAGGHITRDQMLIITQRLNQQIAAAQDEARRLMPNKDIAVLEGLIGPTARQQWDQLDVTRRRAALEVLGLRIAVNPVTRKGPGFDASTIKVTWLARP